MLFHILASGIFIFYFLNPAEQLPSAQYSWPHARIPFEDDPALIQDPDQAVALNNARMDLQVRTCIKMIPRRMENDYVFFTDLGPQVECWNMFLPFPKGRIPVNAGPSCLEPMRRPHRPKRVFSECDVDYVNQLFNCPQKRKVPPICTPSQNMMGPPKPLSTTFSTNEPITETTTENAPADQSGETTVAGEEEDADGEDEEVANTTEGQEEPTEAATEIQEKVTEITTTTAETLETASNQDEENTDAADADEAEDSKTPATEDAEEVAQEETKLPQTARVTSESPSDEPQTPTTTTSESTPSTKLLASTTPSKTSSPSYQTLPASTTTTDFETTTMFLTMITSTSPTTVEVQPPEWVQSVEESFRNRIPDDESSHSTNPERVIKFQPPPDHSTGYEEKIGFVKTLKLKSTEASEDNKPTVIEDVKPDERVHEKSSSETEEKVSTIIERTKFIGPCGSACNYSGDLVKLFRSYNDKPGITDHFYTSDRLEHHLMASEGYIMQPHMGYLGRNHVDPNCTCIKPLYRLYSDFMKDHLLTSTEQEKNIAEGILGYKFERLLGYCTKEPGCGAYLPLYRFYNPINKDHLYTIDQTEMHYYRTHPEQAYNFEHIECYVWQNNSTSKGACPAIPLIIDSTLL